MRAGASLLAALALTAPACTVGGGSGLANGVLEIVGCDSHNTWEEPRPYNLSPSFFAGEPIEDVCPKPGPCDGPHVNRLVIRMQRTANRSVEVNDTVFVDVENALEVAKCLRGRTVNGLPTWDTRVITAPDGAPVPGTPWCDWAASTGVDGGAAAPVDGGAPGMTAPLARINLSTQDYVRASFMPLFTCNETRVTGVALPGSWIDFVDFGSAMQPDLPPNERTKVGNDFKVEFGQRLRAHFHLLLDDQHVIYSIQQRMAVPLPKISGVLDGWFDFDLERGRAAQPFP